MIKITIFLRRKAGMSHKDFVAYHRNNHAPLFRSLAEVKQHVRRYVQCHSAGEQLQRLPDNHIDGSTKLWFDDLAGVFQSPNYMATMSGREKIPDLHVCEFLVGVEHEVLSAEHTQDGRVSGRRLCSLHMKHR